MTNQPKWQRGIIKPVHDDYPETAGRRVWVRVGPPCFRPGTIAMESRKPVLGEPCFDTNLEGLRGGCVGIAPEAIELLPEFADEVAIVAWEDFLQGLDA